MNITEAARAYLLDQLIAIADSGNADALQAMLCGAGLPAMSRDDDPADQIHEALESAGDYAGVALRIARLLAGLVQRRADEMAQHPDAQWDNVYDYNLFLLASRLPRLNELFEGLYRFYQAGFVQNLVPSGTLGRAGRTGFQLRRALSEQQPDTQLRGYWLDLLQDGGRDWSPARRTELMEAWRGLLGTLDFDADLQGALETLDVGLRTLHGSVEPHPEATDLLELALWRLETGFPLYPTTWASYLAPAWKNWPELLQSITARTWPGLEPHDESLPLPGDLTALWAALGENDQTALRGYLQRDAAGEGRKYLTDLIFTPPKINDLAPQAVRALLKKLSEHLWPTGEKAAHSAPHENEERDDAKPARPTRRASFDRQARLEAVNRTLSEIERRLGEDDEAAARRFLDELLEQQRGSPLANQHVHTAKTLAKAAAIVQRFGKLEWAESLLRTACKENHDDKVSACGLADVLKARGELDAAEVQYRQNVERWPNDEVSACGLADVLKARGELVAAETQYRRNVERWPNNEVSACGLADVLKARGELEAAETQYRQNVERWPNDEVSACGLADVLKARGELEAAETQYRRNVERWPNNEVSANGLADVLKARGELEAAETQYRRNVERWPNNEVSANGLAEVLKARGELEAAETQYRRNVARWPNNEVSACGLAEVLKARGELVAAEAQYRQNVARWPNNEVSANGLAEVLKARGELVAAEAQYRRNVERWPNDEVSACGLAEALKARGELEAAATQYRRNVARWPSDRVAINGLANVLRKQKRQAEALSLLPAMENPATPQDGYDLHLRAMILLDLGRLTDARTALELGLSAAIGPRQITLFHSGLALLALRGEDFQRAGEILAALPNNVIPLDLIRLHFEAAQRHNDAASQQADALFARQTKMNSGEVLVFDLLCKDYALSATGVGRQPLQAELDELFDAEIDMQLAA